MQRAYDSVNEANPEFKDWFESAKSAAADIKSQYQSCNGDEACIDSVRDAADAKWQELRADLISVSVYINFVK